MDTKTADMALGNPTKIASYAGYRGAESPRRIVFGDRAVEVMHIIARWREPEYEYLRIHLATGEEAVLRHTLDCDDWVLLDDLEVSPNPP